MNAEELTKKVKERERCRLGMRRIRDERRTNLKIAKEIALQEERESRAKEKRDKDAARKRRKRDLFADAYDQQRRLLTVDHRAVELRRQYQDHIKGGLVSYLAKLSKLALWILESAEPGRNWHGSCCTDVSQEEADYFLLTQESHNRWLRDGNGMKLVVVRDPKYNETRKDRVSITGLWKNILRLDKATSGKMRIDVQDFSGPEPKVKKILVSDAYHRWKMSVGVVSDSNPPMNLLNLASQSVPRLAGIEKHMTFLDDVILDAEDKRALGPGKKYTSATDIKGCRWLRILGQAGAISGWHRDNLGPFTYVTLEDGDDEPRDTNKQSDETVVKLWAVARIDHLTEDQQEAALADFAEERELWIPKDPVRIIVIALVRGDTLIMPPGTIHAPITLTDCLLSGGMCMHKKFVSESMVVWKYLVDNPHCTNENKPQQTFEVVSCIRDRVCSDPEAHGITTRDALQEFEDNCLKVMKKRKGRRLG